MRAVVVVGTLAIALLGCASLQGDGYYGCARSGRCPSSAPVCGSDGLCHTSAVDANVVDAGAVDAPAVDAFVPPLAYEPCDGDTPGTCGAGACYYDMDPTFTHDGYCSRACTIDAECPAHRGLASACIGGTCVRGCTDATCSSSLTCAAGRWEVPGVVALCVTFDQAVGTFYDPCTSDGDCPRPLSCIGGSCLRPCTASTDCVSELETCVASAAGPRACLLTCTTFADCDPFGTSCTSRSCRPDASW
jgi:hypothetical protein